LPRGGELQDDVEHYNAQINTIANELGVTYIDLYPAFLAPDGSIRDDLTLDEVHLTGSGYRLWRSLLEPTMSIYSQPP
jgi:lysophospholipase L1-like esterase